MAAILSRPQCVNTCQDSLIDILEMCKSFSWSDHCFDGLPQDCSNSIVKANIQLYERLFLEQGVLVLSCYI